MNKWYDNKAYIQNILLIIEKVREVRKINLKRKRTLREVKL